MVRRLPVLQNQPAGETPWTVRRAVGVSVVTALLCWAILLWAAQSWGLVGIAVSFVGACGVAGAVVAHRVVSTALRRTALVSTALVAGLVWSLALLGGSLCDILTALAALLGLCALSGIGFALGIFGLFWQWRFRSRQRG